MDFSAIVTGNFEMVFLGVMAFILFFAFAYVPLKIVYNWLKGVGQ